MPKEQTNNDTAVTTEKVSPEENRVANPRPSRFGSIIVTALLVSGLTVGICYALWHGSGGNTTSTQQSSKNASMDKGNFDAKRDGFVRDFSVYQSFGGKLGLAAKSVAYTVFLPTDFGFNLKTDRLQLEVGRVGGGMSVVDDTGTKSNTACRSRLGGTACSVTWGFNDRLEEGEYQVSFKVPDNTTHQKGRIFVKILGGSPAVYAEGGATVFIRKPLTSPYVEVSGMNDGTIYLSKATGLRDYPISVSISSAYNATNATVAIDGQTVDQKNDFLLEENTSYYGGKALVFTLNISKQSQEALVAGTHVVTILVTVPGYGDVLARVGDKDQGTLVLDAQ